MSHLESAVLFALQAKALETGTEEPRLFSRRTEHRAAAVACVFSSVAYLEAEINEFFSDVSDGIALGYFGFSEEVAARISRSWKMGVPRTARYAVLEKYEVALTLCDLPPIPPGEYPHQAVQLLLKLRNALTHFEPEIQPTGGTSYEEEELGKLSRGLRSAFLGNPLAGEHEPFFPYRCLGFGSSSWSVRASFALVKLFRERLDLGYSPDVEKVIAALQ